MGLLSGVSELALGGGGKAKSSGFLAVFLVFVLVCLLWYGVTVRFLPVH